MANYRYFVSGGPERYLFNISEALAKKGHEVIPFSVRYSKNRPTPFDKFFVDPIGGDDEVTFQQHALTPRNVLRLLKRSFYDSGVERAARRITEETCPDIAYVLHYLRKMSPALLVGLKNAGIPIVVRLSDYAMLCPAALCLRDEKPCEKCANGSLWPSILYRCVQNSRGVSFINAAATYFHRWRRYFDLIDYYIVTNPFMMDMMSRAGYPKARIACIPTFVNSDVFRPADEKSSPRSIIYCGRLERIKGVHIAIHALALLRKRRPDLNWRFVIAGGGDSNYIRQLKNQALMESLGDVIHFAGELDARAVADDVARATLSLQTQLCYENLPNALLESYACGTPIIASDIGSLRYSVNEGMNGFHFATGSSASLCDRIEYCLDHPERLAVMAQNARNTATSQYSEASHVERLVSLFRQLVPREFVDSCCL